MIDDMPNIIRETIESVSSRKLADSLIDKIIVAGVGGSAIAGDLLKTYLRAEKMRIDVVRDYVLPPYADEHTLVFLCSYSGDTEEILSVTKDVVKKKCIAFAITHGGKLVEWCDKKGYPYAQIEHALIPRQAAPAMFFIMLSLLEHSKLIPNQTVAIQDMLRAIQQPVFEKTAQELADHLVGKIPIIYTTPSFAPLAYRWKCQFNENTKIHAFCNVLSELNHNEIVGYTKKVGEFHVIILKNTVESEQFNKRMSLTKKLIMEQKCPVTELAIKGSFELTRMFSCLKLGDLTSYYLAQKYGFDPGSIEILTRLKRLMQTV